MTLSIARLFAAVCLAALLATLSAGSARGHDLGVVDAIGAATMVARPLATGPFGGAAEPRLAEAAVGGH